MDRSSLRSRPGVDLPGDLAAAARLGGEMGRRLAAFDWGSHPLGPLANWPLEVRTIVATSMVSRFPVVLWIGPDLSLIYNDGYIPMLGEKHPAALGTPAREVWWEIWDVVGPMLDSVIRTGVPTWSDDLLLMLASSGRPEERYFTFTYSPIIAANGEIPGVFCAVTETTDRVLGQRRLLALNTLAAEVMDKRAADDVVIAAIEVCAAHNADLPFAAVYLRDGASGRATVRAATPGAGDALSQLAPEGSFWGFPEQFAAGARLVEDLDDQLRSGIQPSDGPRPKRVALLPLTDAPNTPPAGLLVLGLNPHRPFDAQYEGFCSLLADQLSAALTNARSHELERERAESLAELDRAKTTFLTNVSHEFRTPLTLMLGPLEDAIVEAQEDRALAERLEIVHRNSQRLLRLVNSLLDFARTEAGGSVPELRLLDLGKLTAQIASSFSEVCARAGLELVVECEPAIVEVDPEMWETVILNLISNAFKFTLEGSITIAVTHSGSEAVEVTVTDTGSGIAAEDLEQLFQRFYRAPHSRGRSAEGSGIGLALVRKLIELHDGTIDLDSQVGVGTRVSIQLPAASAALAPAGVERELALQELTAAGNAYVAEALQWLGELPETQAELPERPLVLVADDNADMRQHLQRILSSRWRTECVSDGEAALEFIRAEHPDLLVTDAMMPTLDGFGLISRVRADQELATLPVILLSARAGTEAAGEGFSAGADDYLIKPFSSQDLLHRVTARLNATTRDRQSAERHDRRTQRLAALSDLATALAHSATVHEALEVLLDSPTAALGATAAAIGIVEPSDGLTRVTYAGELPSEFLDRYHVMAHDAPVPLAEVIRTCEPMIISDFGDLDPHYEALRSDAASAVGAALVEPLRASDGAVVGALALAWPMPRSFKPLELELAAGVASVMIQAVERIKVIEREHTIATQLQERLLDLDTRSPTAVLSATYQPAGELLRVGGDWYTATTLDDEGRIGVSVGDVVGHGLEGATAMSQLRSALGAAALTSRDPGAVIDLLDRYATGVSGASCGTVAYAVIDGADEAVSYACAGHPYPLLVEPDGRTRFLEDGRRLPLASQARQAASSSGYSDLPAGSLLLLYTDGLIERRGESLDDGFARLAEHARTCLHLPVGDVCATLVRALAPRGGYTDDVALVAVRPSGRTAASFVLGIPATTLSVGATRHRLRDWLRSLATPIDQRSEYGVLVGVGEAVINAIEHGSRMDGSRTVWLEVFVHDDRVVASVSDSGSWDADSAASRREARRGRGLTLIHGLSDSVRTIRSILGTRVVMTFSLSGPRRQ